MNTCKHVKCNKCGEKVLLTGVEEIARNNSLETYFLATCSNSSCRSTQYIKQSLETLNT